MSRFLPSQTRATLPERPMFRRRATRAFTLVEMLLVIAIIGILVTMLAPRLQMLGAPRVSAAARTLTQMIRYARTMALLHQTEMELSSAPPGVLRVTPIAGRGQRTATPAAPGTNTLLATVAAAEPDWMSASSFDAPPPTAPPPIADDIAVERQLDKVTVRFLGYSDSHGGFTAKTSPLSAAETGTASAVRFRSNGTCRPHRYRITDVTGAAVVVAVDMIGTTTVSNADTEE